MWQVFFFMYRFNANIKLNGNSEVALAEDSFGNVGQIEISSEGQSTSLTSIDQVIEVTETKEIAQREQSEEEKQEFKSVNETLVKVSKIDENGSDLLIAVVDSKSKGIKFNLYSFIIGWADFFFR